MVDQPQEWLIPIANRLRAAREAVGISQTKAARGANVTPQAWSQWERAMRPPALDALIDFSNRHKVPLDWILRGEISTSLPMDIAMKVLTPRELFQFQPRDRLRK